MNYTKICGFLMVIFSRVDMLCKVTTQFGKYYYYRIKEDDLERKKIHKQETLRHVAISDCVSRTKIFCGSINVDNIINITSF